MARTFAIVLVTFAAAAAAAAAQPISDSPFCCKALTAQCLACAKGMSVEEYCRMAATTGSATEGCPTTTPDRPVPGASCPRGAPVFTSTIEHCGKRVVDMECTCSSDGIVEKTDPVSVYATTRFAWVCAAFQPLPCKPEPTPGQGASHGGLSTLPPPVQCSSLVRCAEGFTCVPGRGCIKDRVTVTIPPRPTTAATPSPCEVAQKAQLAALEQAARAVHAQMEDMIQSLRRVDVETGNLEAESAALKRAIAATGCTE